MKYAKRQGKGWTRVIKEDLYPLFDADTLKAHEDQLSLDRVRRCLNHWCYQSSEASAASAGGRDLKHPVVLYAFEYMLKVVAPDIMAEFSTRERLLHAGDAISAFAGAKRPTDDPLQLREGFYYCPDHVSGVRDGTYALTSDPYSDTEIRPREFLIITDAGRREYQFCQWLRLEWSADGNAEPNPRIIASSVGYLLPCHDPPMILLRSQASETIQIFECEPLSKYEFLFYGTDRVPLFLFATTRLARQLSTPLEHRATRLVWRPDGFAAEIAVASRIASHRIWELSHD